MQAARFHDFGDNEVVSIDTVREPSPDPEELQVRVEAAGVNPLDWLIREGVMEELFDDPLPVIPGWDLSGVVENVGSDVSGFDPGDEVYGMARLPGSGSTWAEQTTVRSESVRPKPAELTHVEAAASPQAALTAAHALFEVTEISEGDRILVHAAAGGVGHFAVQFANNVGAEVVGTASGYNEEFLIELGVDEFVNYREVAFEDVVDPVDVVIDGVGGDVLDRSARITRQGGTIVTLPEEPSSEIADRLRKEHQVEPVFFGLLNDTNPQLLDLVTSHLKAGSIEPTVSGVYPLSEAREALAESQSGHVRGKLVLEI